MKQISLIAAVLLVSLTAKAQDLYQMAGIYAPYPDKETVWHKAPAGYRAVYVSHVGRHGSSFGSSKEQYEILYSILEKAEFAGALSDEGKKLLLEVGKVARQARGRYGSLTTLGFEEQRNIMQRLCARCPELFSGRDRNVEVFSSQKPDCLVSMSAGTDAIKEFNPKLRFVYHANDSLDNGLFNNGLIQTISSNAKSFADRNSAVIFDTKPLIDKFFTDGGRYMKSDTKKNFGNLLLDFASAAWLSGTDIWKFFSKEELLPLWKQRNSQQYYCAGPSEEYSEVSKDACRSLISDMLKSADQSLSEGKFRASLRYGHDSKIIALANFLGIGGCCKSLSQGQAVEDIWRDYEILPMSANLQMVFFRKAGNNDVLVKVLLNEKESHLEGITTDCWPFYHWKDVRRSLYERIGSLPSFTMNGWQCDSLKPGLVFMRYSGYEKVSRANQLISVVVVDLNNPRYTVDFSFAPGFSSTSDAFKKAGAVVSMNASYEKVSVVIKTEDTLRYNIKSNIVPSTGAVPQWKTDCAICTDGRKVSIEYTGKGKTIPEMREAYAAMQWPEILSSSPMLIEKGVPVGKYFAANNLSSEEFGKLNYEDPLRHQGVRHPRSAVALTADNHLILICVDGRRSGIAAGMNAWELTTFIESQFHPVDAINMDGGGSTTMCVKGLGATGTNVVNYPSNTSVFNHGKERSVPTHIHIIDKGN